MSAKPRSVQYNALQALQGHSAGGRTIWYLYHCPRRSFVPPSTDSLKSRTIYQRVTSKQAIPISRQRKTTLRSPIPSTHSLPLTLTISAVPLLLSIIKSHVLNSHNSRFNKFLNHPSRVATTSRTFPTMFPILKIIQYRLTLLPLQTSTHSFHPFRRLYGIHSRTRPIFRHSPTSTVPCCRTADVTVREPALAKVGMPSRTSPSTLSHSFPPHRVTR